MTRPRPFHPLLHGMLVAALLFSTSTPALLAQEDIYLPLITNGQQGQSSLSTNRLFRTHVSANTPAQWRDLAALDVVILEREADSALLLVDDEQLATLARLRYNPEATNALATLAAAQPDVRAALAALLTQAATLEQPLKAADPARSAEVATARQTLRAAMQALDTQQRGVLSQAATVDSDNDGLTDDQEGWWCTDATKPDSDFDGTKDGAEVAALNAWMNNQRAAYPSSGKPFQGWPHQKTNCFDDDQDSVPDLAESLHIGLNPSRESTDRDKFDDGQELFGQTYCTGQGGFCSYGPLPRNEDWGVIFAEMPSWVKAPGNHPLVAAFPIPEIDVTLNQITVERITTITTAKGEMRQQSKTYSTAKTEGTSTSEANTETWEEWQEVSQTRETAQASSSNNIGVALKLLAVANLTTNNSFTLNNNKHESGSLISKFGEAAASRFGERTTDFVIDEACAEIQCRKYIGSAIRAGVRTAIGSVDTVQTALNSNSCPKDILGKVKCSYEALKTNLVDNYNQRVTAFTTEEQQNHGLTDGQIANIGGGNIDANQVYGISFPPPSYLPAAFTPTTTETKGSSQGGAHTVTHARYEEHTVTNGEAFTTGEDWSTATAVNAAYAAEMTFP